MSEVVDTETLIAALRGYRPEMFTPLAHADDGETVIEVAPRWLETHHPICDEAADRLERQEREIQIRLDAIAGMQRDRETREFVHALQVAKSTGAARAKQLDEIINLIVWRADGAENPEIARALYGIASAILRGDKF